MPLVTLVFHLLSPQWKGAVWTQTLRLAPDDSGVTTWRRQWRTEWETERWTSSRGGEPREETAEGNRPPRQGISRPWHWQMAIRYDAAGAHTQYTDSGGRRTSATIAAPKGISRALPTPRVYRRAAHPGGRFRFTKFDAWAGRWNTIESTYAGAPGGAPVFRERNLTERVTWTYTFDRNFEIAGVELGNGASLRRVSAKE